MRGLYHGILQIGVGLHHWRNGNHHGATVLLAEGRARLAPFAPACQGVDVARLIADTVALEDELARLGPERMAALDPARIPTIRPAGGQAGGSSTGATG